MRPIYEATLKKIDNSELFIGNFMVNLFEFMKSEEELFIDIFNSPIVRDPLYKLEVL